MSSVFLSGSFRFKMRLIVSKLCRWLSRVSSRLNYTYGVRNFKKQPKYDSIYYDCNHNFCTFISIIFVTESRKAFHPSLPA